MYIVGPMEIAFLMSHSLKDKQHHQIYKEICPETIIKNIHPIFFSSIYRQFPSVQLEKDIK